MAFRLTIHEIRYHDEVIVVVSDDELARKILKFEFEERKRLGYVNPKVVIITRSIMK